MCDSLGEPSNWMKVMGAWLLGAALLELERSGKLIVTWCERQKMGHLKSTWITFEV